MVTRHPVQITANPPYRVYLPIPRTPNELARLDIYSGPVWRRTLELARRKEAWIHTVMRAHHYTERELRKHATIYECMEWRSEDEGVITLTLVMHWTLWMRFKRWLRREGLRDL